MSVVFLNATHSFGVARAVQFVEADPLKQGLKFIFTETLGFHYILRNL
jgi:hypothetical protein